MASTHYDLLGLQSDADDHEITAVRRRLLAAAHPDRGLDAADRERREAISVAIAAAADVLLDPRRRRAYDRTIGLRRAYLPTIPAPARRAARAATTPLLHTRGGQWALLGLLALLLGLFGTEGWLAGLLVGITALLLARPGDPTPLGDVERGVTAVRRWITGSGARYGRRALRSAGSALRERANEAGLGPTGPRDGAGRSRSDDGDA